MTTGTLLPPLSGRAWGRGTGAAWTMVTTCGWPFLTTVRVTTTLRTFFASATRFGAGLAFTEFLVDCTYLGRGDSAI